MAVSCPVVAWTHPSQAVAYMVSYDAIEFIFDYIYVSLLVDNLFSATS